MAGDFISEEWLGMKAMQEALAQLGENAEKAAFEIITQGAAMVEQAAKDNFQGAHKKGEPHVGGNKPNIVTGSLRRSVHSDPVEKIGHAYYRTSIGPRMIYGRRVELGYNGSAKYPYFEPAVRSVEPKLAALQARVFRKYLL